jgi:hypothetical protein
MTDMPGHDAQAEWNALLRRADVAEGLVLDMRHRLAAAELDNRILQRTLDGHVKAAQARWHAGLAFGWALVLLAALGGYLAAR